MTTHRPETPTKFIVGATYEMLAYCHSSIPRGNIFTVAYIDIDGNAQVFEPRCTFVNRRRLRKNEVRLVSLPDQKEAIMTSQDAYKVLFEDFKSRVPVGSTVRLVRHWSHEEAQRWDTDHFTINMTDRFPVGTELEIAYYSGRNVRCNGWNFPITCLEVVSTKPAYQTVKLNDQYEAKVYEDKIVVGCQEFPCGVIGDLLRTHMKVINP